MWKFLNKGLLATLDESECIGTFHCDQRATPERKREIQRLICTAEDNARLLRRLIELCDPMIAPENADADRRRVARAAYDIRNKELGALIREARKLLNPNQQWIVVGIDATGKRVFVTEDGQICESVNQAAKMPEEWAKSIARNGPDLSQARRTKTLTAEYYDEG